MDAQTVMRLCVSDVTKSDFLIYNNGPSELVKNGLIHVLFFYCCHCFIVLNAALLLKYLLILSSVF